MNQNFILNFYKFVQLKNLISLKQALYQQCNKNHLKGTIIIADEGINCSLMGFKDALENIAKFLATFEEFKDIDYNYNKVDEEAFDKLKINIKPEIIKFIANVDANSSRKYYVEADQWDRLITLKDVTLIDTRNKYEIAYGSFCNAINPNIDSFTELKQWMDKNLKDKDEKIAMYCTGGIRCEKSIAYLANAGFKNIFHLKGGILNYLKNQQQKKLWQGNLFVFDNRVAIDHNLKSFNTL